MKKLILYISLLLPVLVIGQGSIVGTITTTEGKAVTDAEVYVDEMNLLVKADQQGRFTIAELVDGDYTLTVFSYLYNTITQSVSVQGVTKLSMMMEPFGSELSEVEIVARRENLFTLKRLSDVEGTAIYSGKKSEVVLIGQSPANLASNNARQIYAQVVGLNIYENNDGGLQLNIGGRGLDPNRSSHFNTRQNGYDISADVLGYPESYYTPPAEALEKIQIVRGAASLQYGTQFGGLVNFIMKQGNASKPLEFVSRNTIGSYGSRNNFVSIGGQAKKIRYFGFLQRKNGDGYRDNSQYQSDNAYVHIDYQLFDNTHIQLDYTKLDYLAQQAGGLTDTQFDLDPRYSNRTRNWFEVDWNLYALKVDHEFNAHHKLSFQISVLDAARNTVGFRGDPRLFNVNPITALDEQNVDGTFILPTK